MEALKQEIDEKMMREVALERKELVGKCFKYRESAFQYTTYGKVLREKSQGEFQLPVLIFKSEPHYCFNKINKMGELDKSGCGRYFFSSINIRDIFVDELKEWEEISEKEYNDAMNLYIIKLQKLDWSKDIV